MKYGLSIGFCEPTEGRVANLGWGYLIALAIGWQMWSKSPVQNDWFGAEPRKRPIYYVWPAGVDHSRIFGKSASRLPAVLIFRISVWLKAIG